MRRKVFGTAVMMMAMFAPTAAQASRPALDVDLFTTVPAPGYPAEIARAPDGSIYVGSYVPSAGNYDGPAEISVFSAAGQLRTVYRVEGQDTGTRHGVNAFAFDRGGRLYFATQNLDDHGKPSRVWRLNPHTGAQVPYGTLPDVSPCSDEGTTDCSATRADDAPHPDFAAFGPGGALYVTDFQQALVWRIPRGGGVGKVWLTDPRLDGGAFGTAGIRFRPGGDSILVSTMTADASLGPFPSTVPGAIYDVPLQANGRAGEMRLFWRSASYDGPDGFAVARSGNVYVALALNNQLAELSPNGEEIARIPATPAPSPAVNPTSSSVPFDTPSGVIFDAKRLLVTNIATATGFTEDMVVFDIWAGERGAPLYYPRLRACRRHSGVHALNSAVPGRPLRAHRPRC